MRIEIRKTAAGTEYWDNVEKRSVFVPKGKEPGFEVTKNPKNMIHTEENKQEEKEVDIETMNLKQLKEHAAELNIELPTEARTKDQIKSAIKGEEVADD